MAQKITNKWLSKIGLSNVVNSEMSYQQDSCPEPVIICLFKHILGSQEVQPTKGKLVFLCFSIFFVAATSEGGAGGRHIPDHWDSVAVAALVLHINVPALLVCRQKPNCGKLCWSLEQPNPNPAGCVHFRPSCPVNAVLTKHPMEPDPRFSICTICFNFVCRRICAEQNFFELRKKGIPASWVL